MLELAGKEVFRKMAAMVDCAAMDLLLERRIRGEMEVVDMTVGRVQMVSLGWLAATACQVRNYLLHLHIVSVVVQAAVAADPAVAEEEPAAAVAAAVVVVAAAAVCILTTEKVEMAVQAVMVVMAALAAMVALAAKEVTAEVC
jgi:hypothetical protein